MIRSFNIFFLLLLIFSCVEPYEFNVRDDQRTIVVEAVISDKSFTETLSYPSDGRYFSVKLSLTSNVTNVRPERVSGAAVSLLDDQGNVWTYLEVETGIYQLRDNDFKARRGVAYKLKFSYSEDVYESSWEKLPDIDAPVMGDIGHEETERQVYVVEANEQVLRTRKGIATHVTVPINPTGNSIFYRWVYTPTWIYRAPLASSSSPGYICWATDVNYLADYTLQMDNVGGYRKDLFFMETVRNARLFERFSLLLTQYSMNEDFYYFWKEMKDQVSGGALLDAPPFNLQTNITCLSQEKKVSGYFGVAGEQARRWYFNIKDLSYTVVNTLKGDCEVDYGGPPAPECTDCREYSFGKTTTNKPSWWMD